MIVKDTWLCRYRIVGIRSRPRADSLAGGETAQTGSNCNKPGLVVLDYPDDVEYVFQPVERVMG